MSAFLAALDAHLLYSISDCESLFFFLFHIAPSVGPSNVFGLFLTLADHVHLARRGRNDLVVVLRARAKRANVFVGAASG